MPPGQLSYRRGIEHWLLIFFHSEATVEEAGETLQIAPNTLFIWPPGAPQRYGHAKEEWDHSWIHLSGTELEPLLDSHQLKSLEPIEFQLAAPFEQFLSEAHNEVSRWTEPDPRILRNLLENTLINLKRNSHNPARPEDNLLRVKMLIDADPAPSRTLAEMAQEAHLSVSHFSARFRQAFGQSPVQYLTSRKIDLAKHILRTRSMNISEVATLVGYDDPYHFSRMFKNETGQSPRAWRTASVKE